MRIKRLSLSAMFVIQLLALLCVLSSTSRGEPVGGTFTTDSLTGERKREHPEFLSSGIIERDGINEWIAFQFFGDTDRPVGDNVVAFSSNTRVIGTVQNVPGPMYGTTVVILPEKYDSVVATYFQDPAHSAPVSGESTFFNVSMYSGTTLTDVVSLSAKQSGNFLRYLYSLVAKDKSIGKDVRDRIKGLISWTSGRGK